VREFLERILDDTELRLENYKRQMKEFEKDPMILVKEVFADGDVLLPLLVQRYGEDVLLDIQDYWFTHFLPAFKRYLGVDGITLAYDRTIYPAPIQIVYREEPMALVEIVTHQYERLEPENVMRMKEEIARLEERIAEIEKELGKWDPALKNPLVLGGANPFKLMDIQIRKKKYKAKVLKEVGQLQDELFECDRERLRLKSALENERRLNVDRELRLERIERKLMRLPGFDRQAFGKGETLWEGGREDDSTSKEPNGNK
jgi:hypothetical protein